MASGNLQRVSRTEPTAALRVAAGLSFAAALIHAAVITEHFREYWLFGVFFVVAAVFQLVWAGATWSGLRAEWLLAVGAAGNLAIAAVWALSRTVGLPLGPEAGEPEQVDAHDLLATANELALALIVLWVLARRSPPGWAIAGGWWLAAAGAISAFLGPHGPG